MQHADRPRISVVGAHRIVDEVEATAERIGEALAGRDVVLVTGGLGGVMAAACRGYKQAGGPLSVGILPGEDRSAANDHVDLAVATGLGHARNALVALNGDVVVALPGAGGTMSEIGMARAIGTPVVAVGFWDDQTGVTVAKTVEEALDRVDEVLSER